MEFLFEGQRNNTSVHILIDTGAADNFISTALIQEQQLTIKKGPAVTIQLADGSTTQASETCQICLKFTQDTVVHYTTMVRCRLAPLASATHVIQGEPWLHRHQAILSYAEHCFYVANKKHLPTIAISTDFYLIVNLGNTAKVPSRTLCWALSESTC